MDERALSTADLGEVTCRWGEAEDAPAIKAAIVHVARGMLVLEPTAGQAAELPPPGTVVHVRGEAEELSGRLADLGRGGRFLLTIGDRPVRSRTRSRVSLPATVRAPSLSAPVRVEISDLTSAGARVRGIELPVDSPVTLEFTPPEQESPVKVRGVVAHGTRRAHVPWIGVVFRLVAMRGGRED